MSKKTKKQKRLNTEEMANVPNSSGFAITISKKTLRRVLYALPIILLAVIITCLFFAQSRRSVVYHANKPLVICDTLGFNHYIGAGNEITINKNASLIIHNDTVVVGDSIVNLLCSQYLDSSSDKDCEDNNGLTNNKDTIILAEAKQDLELHSIDNHNVLYVKGKERFHVDDTVAIKDSVCLRFNDVLYKAVANDLTFDSISVAELNGNPDILESFKPLFVIWDSVRAQLSVRMKSLESDNANNDSLQDKNVFSLYYVNRDSLLGKVKEIDTTYVFNLASRVDTTDHIELRVASPKHLSIVVSAQKAVNIFIPKDEVINKSSSRLIILLFLLLSALILLLVCKVLYSYFTKRMTNNSDKGQRIIELEETIQRLEKEIEELKDSSLTIPDDPNDYEDWFNSLNPKEGNSGYFEICKDNLDKWRKALHDQSEDVDFYLSKFQEYIELYIQTLSISVESLSAIETKTAELEQKRTELDRLTHESIKVDESPHKPISDSTDVKALNKRIGSLEHELEDLRNKLSSSELELAHLRQSMSYEIEKVKKKAKSECEERVRKAEDRARREVDEANERTRKAKERAEEAERRAREIREEVTNQFKAEIQGLKEELKNRQETINQMTQSLNENNRLLKTKEQECANLSQDLQNKIEALKAYSERITDVQPAGTYAKTVLKLLQIGHDVEKAADKLLEKGIDDYLLTKYITRYQKALHQLDMDQFATDVLNIANVQFVYRQQPLAKYDQHDVKKFRESMKLFFFESYLRKYIDALMVFNETMAGLYHLVDGLTESDAKVFEQCRKELNSVFKDLEIEVNSVKIFDSIADNVDLSVKMRPLDFDCPSGTICQIDSCLVYLAGGNKPSDKIQVIVKE